jgi:hypothetical protein
VSWTFPLFPFPSYFQLHDYPCVDHWTIITLSHSLSLLLIPTFCLTVPITFRPLSHYHLGSPLSHWSLPNRLPPLLFCFLSHFLSSISSLWPCDYWLSLYLLHPIPLFYILPLSYWMFYSTSTLAFTLSSIPLVRYISMVFPTKFWVFLTLLLLDSWT